MRHALGKTPNTNHDLWETFNDAGRTLFTCAMIEPWNHEWTWAQTVTYDIDIPASVDAFDAPEGFGQLVQVGYETTVVKSVKVVSVTEMEDLRRSVVTPTGVIYVAYPYPVTRKGVIARRKGTRVAPRDMIGVYPQQDAAVTDLKWTFQRVWVDLHDDDNEGRPDIDPMWEHLLLLIAQSKAKVIEDQEDDWLGPSIQSEIDRLVAFDSNRSFDARPTRYSVRAQASRRFGSVRDFRRVTKT